MKETSGKHFAENMFSIVVIANKDAMTIVASIAGLGFMSIR